MFWYDVAVFECLIKVVSVKSLLLYFYDYNFAVCIFKEEVGPKSINSQLALIFLESSMNECRGICLDTFLHEFFGKAPHSYRC